MSLDFRPSGCLINRLLWIIEFRLSECGRAEPNLTVEPGTGNVLSTAPFTLLLLCGVAVSVQDFLAEISAQGKKAHA